MAKVTTRSTVDCDCFHNYEYNEGMYNRTILIIIKTTAILKNIRSRFRAFPLNIIYTLPYVETFAPAFTK